MLYASESGCATVALNILRAEFVHIVVQVLKKVLYLIRIFQTECSKRHDKDSSILQQELVMLVLVVSLFRFRFEYLMPIAYLDRKRLIPPTVRCTLVNSEFLTGYKLPMETRSTRIRS